MKNVPINDSILYKVTLVVAIPNYSSDMGSPQVATGSDLVMEMLGHEPEISVLDVSEQRLELSVVNDDE